jgi:sialate O-acetylesterase
MANRADLVVKAVKAIVVVAAMVGAPAAAHAELKVPAWVGAHMVVQQGRPVPLAGTAAPGETVRATLGAAAASTKAGADGRWRLVLPAVPAGGPLTLTIAAASATLRFDDVRSGEVWLASGQSNMELPLNRSRGGGDATAEGCAGLRLFVVSHAGAAAPASQVDGRWEVCDATNAAAFSAVAFHFGREIHRALGVPVGLVEAAWGGTPAEAWTPRPALAAEPTLLPMLEETDAATRDPARRAAVARALADWEAKSFHQDTGNRGEALGYARPDGGGHGWTKMTIPQVWENAGLAIDGAVWFRREVVLPADWRGQDLALSLGAIDDFDVTYWNGERVGATGTETPQYWSVPRNYKVPGRLVKPGRNLIAVRVFDHYGNGGFAGTAAQMTVVPLAAAADPAIVSPVSLAGSWSYKIERRLKPAVVDFSTRPVVAGPDEPTTPTVLWNGMVAPLAGLPLAGVIWYQGESNVGRARQYRTLFPVMIRAWRTAWGDPALPFLFVQLPNYDEPGPRRTLGDSNWAELREAQVAALALPRTAMAVTLDVGEGGDLHPRNKQEVGRRLALSALKVAYGRSAIASGPTFVSAAREGRAMRVRFGALAGGLDTADGASPRGFMLAGADRVWHPAATTRIDGDTVVVSSPDVPEPIAVRYGWGNDPPNTLRNQADLPAAPFRTDDWPAVAASASAGGTRP